MVQLSAKIGIQPLNKRIGKTWVEKKVKNEQTDVKQKNRKCSYAFFNISQIKKKLRFD